MKNDLDAYRQQQHVKFLAENQRQEALAAEQQAEALVQQHQENLSKITALIQTANDLYKEIRIFQENFYAIFSGKLVEVIFKQRQKRLLSFMPHFKTTIDTTTFNSLLKHCLILSQSLH